MSGTVRSPYDHIRRLANRPSAQPAATMPTTVDGGHGRVPAAQTDNERQVPPSPATKPMTTRDAERLMAAELLGACRSLTESTTALSAQLGGRRGAVNGVLLVRLVTFDVEGRWTYAGPVAIGSARVDNHSAAAAVVVSSGQQSSRPAGGNGVQLIAAGKCRPVAVADHCLTLFGTAGEQVSVQIFTGLQAFGGQP